MNILRSMSRLGPRVSLDVAVNTVRTLAADVPERRRARRRVARARARTPGRLIGIEPLTERRASGRAATVGARCRFSEAELEIRFVAPDMVRVSWGPDDPPPPWALASFDALGGPGAPRPAPPRAVTVSGAVVGTRALSVHVGTDGSLRYVARGVQVRHEGAPVRRGPRRTLRWGVRPGEAVCGLGEQAGRADLSGTVHRLWNTDPAGAWGPGDDPLYCVIPVLVGLHPDGNVLTFFENPHDATVRVGAAPVVGRAAAEAVFEGGMLRHYVAVGPLPTLMERYCGLTGRPPLPPRWALGYHQSRWGYRSESDIRAVADGFAAERLPLSAVHLDIDHMDGFRVFSVDTARFPDLAGLCADLAATRVVTIVDPAVKVDPEFDVYGSGTYVTGRGGRPVLGAVWPGTAVFPDFTDPAARRWWAGLYPRLVDQGVAGVWHDMNEPTSITFAGDRTLPLGARHDAEGAGADHRACHNAYGALMDHAGAAALRQCRPDRRPFVLSRSGWAGVQRSSWCWTGDSRSTWEALRQQVATVVGLGLSGVAFSGPDIGGFAGTPSPELYLRWLEMALAMGLCRTHCVSSAPGREPWRFPEPYRAAIGRLVRLRYRLLPYLYTVAHEAATTGYPMVRPAGWPTALGTPDCFLLGDCVLAAPVSVAGATARRVSLPPGAWVPWAGGEALSGTVELEAPLGAPPLLVRAGSVLPLDDGPHDDVDFDHAPRHLAFHLFPDRAGRAAGTVYDDAGDGYGPGRIDTLSLADGELTWTKDGDWPAPERVRVVLHRPDGERARECGAFERLDLS